MAYGVVATPGRTRSAAGPIDGRRGRDPVRRGARALRRDSDRRARRDERGRTTRPRSMPTSPPNGWSSKLTSAESVSTVVDTLTAGRYALACARARAHGRSRCRSGVRRASSTHSTDRRAQMSSGRRRSGPTRRVPACAQDAARIRAGEEPGRSGWSGTARQQVPAWEAGAPNEPYRIGFFAASGGPGAGDRAEDASSRARAAASWGTDLGKRPKPRRPYD